MVRRRGWQRILPNRKGAHALIVVPVSELEAEDWRDRPTDAQQPPTPPDITPFHAKALAALEDAVSGLREAGKAKDDQIATLREGITRAEARADRLETAVAGERARSDALRERLVAAEEAAGRARADAQAAQDGVHALRRENDARRARGRWGRVLAAWRGE